MHVKGYALVGKFSSKLILPPITYEDGSVDHHCSKLITNLHFAYVGKKKVKLESWYASKELGGLCEGVYAVHDKQQLDEIFEKHFLKNLVEMR